ncbi:MAG: hypothetical protein M3Q45_04790 [Chloroflexota bacterium]|nr:hypothetical protein [Chloroflexota bacterium]
MTTLEPTQSPPAPPVVCALGRPLWDCWLRRAGCGSRYDVLSALYPPPALFSYLWGRPDVDLDVARWVQRLEQIGGYPFDRNRHTVDGGHRRL